ncbi:hypothetical protein I7I48_02711 [Histoplasma ohiense]|nr:hypothetical protein I7I48_02711 [Histoplasma ohiense (nom. inval.)]
MHSPLSVENVCLTPIWSRRRHRTRNSPALSIVRSVSRPCTIRIPCRSHDRRSTYLCLSLICRLFDMTEQVAKSSGMWFGCKRGFIRSCLCRLPSPWRLFVENPKQAVA